MRYEGVASDGQPFHIRSLMVPVLRAPTRWCWGLNSSDIQSGPIHCDVAKGAAYR